MSRWSLVPQMCLSATRVKANGQETDFRLFIGDKKKIFKKGDEFVKVFI